MTKEVVWKEIKNYEGLYVINNMGIIKRLPLVVNKIDGTKQTYKERILKITLCKSHGYFMVALNKNKLLTHYLLHRLLAIAFIDNPLNKPTVNHKNGIKTDISLNNLEWNTQSENNFHSYKELNKKAAATGKTAFNAKKVICIETGTIYPSIKAASEKVKFSFSRVAAMLSGKCKNKTSLVYL